MLLPFFLEALCYIDFIMRNITRASIIVSVLILVALTAPLAVADDDGKAAFLGAKCNMCHAVPSQSIDAKVTSEKMKGPDMPGATASHDATELGKYLRKQVQLNGKDHKKEFTGSDEDLAKIVAWLQALKSE